MPLGAEWYNAFLAVIQRSSLANPLREAALSGQRREWTRLLTEAVVQSCSTMGWRAVAKGHPAAFMPPTGSRTHQEYLGLDVMAFGEPGPLSSDLGIHWPFPLAVFELENRDLPERMAFSLWKVLMARAQMRALLVYTKNRKEIPSLVRALAGAVIPGLSPREVTEAAPGLLLIVGTRAKADEFPYGFFHEWVLNPQTSTLRRP